MATKNKMKDLRDHLFATLEDLRDDDKKFDIERAKAIVDVSQTIINTAKTEIDFIKATGSTLIPDFMVDEPKKLS